MSPNEAENFYKHCDDSLNIVLRRIASCNDPSIRRVLVAEFYSWIFFSLQEQIIFCQTSEEIKRLYYTKKRNTQK